VLNREFQHEPKLCLEWKGRHQASCLAIRSENRKSKTDDADNGIIAQHSDTRGDVRRVNSAFSVGANEMRVDSMPHVGGEDAGGPSLHDLPPPKFNRHTHHKAKITYANGQIFDSPFIITEEKMQVNLESAASKHGTTLPQGPVLISSIVHWI